MNFSICPPRIKIDVAKVLSEVIVVIHSAIIPVGEMQHIEFLRECTSKPLVVLKKEVKHLRRLKKTTVNHVEDNHAPFIREIREDTIILKGVSRKIRRVFVDSGDAGDYHKVGWVANGDVDCCMICLTTLSSFSACSKKHHCRACGNVTCSKCSDEEAIVLEIHTLGPVRVCKQCYWGQVSTVYFYFVI